MRGVPDNWWVSLVWVRVTVQWVETLWFCFLRVRHLFFLAMSERQSLQALLMSSSACVFSGVAISA